MMKYQCKSFSTYINSDMFPMISLFDEESLSVGLELEIAYGKMKFGVNFKNEEHRYVSDFTSFSLTECVLIRINQL